MFLSSFSHVINPFGNGASSRRLRTFWAEDSPPFSPACPRICHPKKRSGAPLKRDIILSHGWMVEVASGYGCGFVRIGALGVLHKGNQTDPPLFLELPRLETKKLYPESRPISATIQGYFLGHNSQGAPWDGIALRFNPCEYVGGPPPRPSSQQIPKKKGVPLLGQPRPQAMGPKILLRAAPPPPPPRPAPAAPAAQATARPQEARNWSGRWFDRQEMKVTATAPVPPPPNKSKEQQHISAFWPVLSA